MKKINLILALSLLVAGISSCEGDDEVTFTKENFLAGKWNVTQIAVLSPQNTINYEAYENCDVDHLIFTEDGSYQENNFQLVEGTCTNMPVNGTFVFDNGNVIITHPDVNAAPATHIKRVISLGYEEMEIVYTDSITDKMVFKKLVKE